MSKLPTGWEPALLSELGEPGEQTVLTGPFGANLGKEDFIASGVPVFTIGCLATDGIVRPKLLHVSASKAAELSSYRLREGDFLFSRMASVGRAGFVPADLSGALFNYHLMRVRLNGEIILPHVFLYFVRGSEVVREYLDDVSRGATRDGINTKLLLNMPVHIPPLPEQRRIVSKIDSLSAKSRRARDHLNHIPRLVEKYKQAILAAAHAQAEKRSVGLTTLADVALEVRNGLSKKPLDGPSGVPILRISAVRPLSVRLDDVRYYPDSESVPETAMLANGDLLFTRYNGNPDLTASCGMVRGLNRSTTYPDKLIRVRLSEVADAQFVEVICASPQTRMWLAPHIKTAAGQHGISGGDLKRLPVPLPPLEEQRRIATSVSTAIAWINRLASETRSARKLIAHLDQAALAQAFRGELVPQDPNDEPASVLLERIRRAKSMGDAKAKRRDARGKSRSRTAPSNA